LIRDFVDVPAYIDAGATGGPPRPPCGSIPFTRSTALPQVNAKAGKAVLSWRPFPALPPLSMIELSVNGEPKRVPSPADIARLLETLQLTGKKVAVERNGEIVPRSRYSATSLADGDRLEIVVAVGGG
jgi:sulfur carrier protein